jgi:hypothetical protein
MGARQVLIVAEQTADTRMLQATLARLADRYSCAFTVLVPVRTRGVYRGAGAAGVGAAGGPAGLGVGGAEAWLDATLPALSRAAGHEVVGLVGREEPLMATRDALNLLGFDQVIIWMPPAGESRWLHLDLPRRVRALGVPVSQVINAAVGAGESAVRG